MLDFVVYSLPFSQEFLQFQEDENGIDKFYISNFSFYQNAQVFKGSTTKASLSSVSVELSELLEIKKITQSEYEQKVNLGIDFSKDHNGKIVLSRTGDFEIDLDVYSSLKNLRTAFPNAFVYLLKINEEVWMGATPETLVKKEQHNYSTMSLAGTKWEKQPFEEKEILEQHIVTEQIKKKLQPLEVAVSEVYESGFGSIRHLRADLAWKSDNSLLDVGRKLHPTPAVCGYPEEEAYKAIIEIEKYDRKLYTGFLGVEDANENGHLFVNLRCMQLFRKHIRFYAGGGINAMSNPTLEWEETNRKMKSVLEVL